MDAIVTLFPFYLDSDIYGILPLSILHHCKKWPHLWTINFWSIIFYSNSKNNNFRQLETDIFPIILIR